MTQSKSSAQLAILFSGVAIISLILSHIVSPEFDPAWRMVSEYANGNNGWLLTIMFTTWGIASLALAYSLASSLKSRTGKAGLVLLIIAGICQFLAGIFNIKHPLHDLVGNLGIPAFALASILISRNLSRDTDWAKHAKTTSYFVVISVILMIVSFIILMMTYMQSGADLTAGAPTTLPNGVIALVGYANRLLILVYSIWVSVTAFYSIQQSYK